MLVFPTTECIGDDVKGLAWGFPCFLYYLPSYFQHLVTHVLLSFQGDKMIINLGCAEFYSIMAVVILLIMLPVAAWIIRRQLNKSKKHKQTPVAPLMYITAVSTNRMADIDVPVSKLIILS